MKAFSDRAYTILLQFKFLLMEILDDKLFVDDKGTVSLQYRVTLYLFYYLLCTGSLYLGDFVETNRLEPFWSVTGGLGVFMISMFTGLIYLCVKLLPRRWLIAVRVILFFPILGAGIFTTLEIENFRGMNEVDEFALESSFMLVTILILIELLRFLDHLWIYNKKEKSKP